MKQEPQNNHASERHSPPGMEHATDMISDFGAPRKAPAPAVKSTAPTPKAAPVVAKTANKNEAPSAEKKPKSPTKKKPASPAKAKQNAKSNETVQATTATKGGTAAPQKSKKSAAQREPSLSDVPRSTKPAHQIIPYVLWILAFLVGISLLLNLFCNFGNQLQEDPGAHWMGKLGYYLCFALFGVFGPAVFALPLILINLAIYWKKYVDHRITISKIVASFLALLFLSSLIHVFCLIGLDGVNKELSASFLLESGAKMTGGGVLGGKLGYLLYDLGSYVGGIH